MTMICAEPRPASWRSPYRGAKGVDGGGIMGSKGAS